MPHRRMRGVTAAGLAMLTAVVLGLPGGVPAADDGRATGAADLVMRQLALLRAHDFASAYALVSRELRRTFSPKEFEWMVKRAHPEIATSTHAFVVRTHESAGYVYVTVKLRGRNGHHVEALYEIVREGEAFRVNALSTRRGDEVL